MLGDMAKRAATAAKSAFELAGSSGDGVGPLTPTGDAHSAAALPVDGDATAVNKPGAYRRIGTSRASTTQRGQDRSSTGSSQDFGCAGNVNTQSAPAGAQPIHLTLVRLQLDVIPLLGCVCSMRSMLSTLVPVGRRSSPTSRQMVATSRASTTRSPRIILLLAASSTPIPQMFVRLPDLGTLRLNVEALT